MENSEPTTLSQLQIRRYHFSASSAFSAPLRLNGEEFTAEGRRERREELDGFNSSAQIQAASFAGNFFHRLRTRTAVRYVAMKHIGQMHERELKKGSAELLILSLVEDRARHGYEIAKLIELRSDGRLRFKVASLYPLLYRLEERGWIQGKWIEKAGERRRRFYRITATGRRVLAEQRDSWLEFVDAIRRITGIEHV